MVKISFFIFLKYFKDMMKRATILKKLYTILQLDKPDLHRINLFLLYLERSLDEVEEDKSKNFEQEVFKLLQRIINENRLAFVEVRPIKNISRL
ncbi:MAG: hypothetical protein ISQ46_03895 [Methylophilaceae bacterium]|nr:hypothetical protein [Methylophilaceae bacterium]